MTGDHEPFGEYAAAYALGALDGEDLAWFRAHLTEGCGICDQSLTDYQAALVQVAIGVSQAPPRRLKRVVSERLFGRGGAARGQSRFWSGFRWAASVAVAAGILGTVGSLIVAGRYESRLGELARELATVRGQLRQQGIVMTLLRDPTTRVVPLAGLEPSPGARGRMIWHPGEGGVLLVANLPPSPREKTYELWVISVGKPIPAGLFGVDASGRGTVLVAPLPGAPPADQFAVTLEPAAGVPAPTGPMYLASSSL